MNTIAHAAGVMCVAPDGSMLLMRRTDGQGWAFPGGHIEPGETAEIAARRELKEETGYGHDGALEPWTRRIKDGVDFTTHLAHVESQFTPTLNDEHDKYLWTTPDAALNGDGSVVFQLHPGVKVALLKFDMDELGIAKAMRSGEMVSPQRYGNILLIAIRITGTGAAYRKGIDEFVWRDPTLYLNDYFLERCNGLPVIVEHPTGGQPLDSEEFKDRIVGTILLPYIEGDEVWGIAKIYDDATAAILEYKPLSTSPCVVFRREDVAGAKQTLPNGSQLLIEGKPSLLDHVAITELGVWDKGGEATGVKTVQSDGVTPGVTVMAEEKHEPKADAEGIKESHGEGDKLDKVLSHLDSLHKMCDSLSSRMDAFETSSKKEPPEEKGEPAALAADKKSDSEDAKAEEKHLEKEEEKEPPKADAEEQPETEKETSALKEEREENKLKANDSFAKADSVSALEKQIADLNKRIPVELKEEDRARFVDAQVKAERVAQAFGDSASRWLNGETLVQYRRRLLAKFKQHSAEWKARDLGKVPEEMLDIAEKAIYADAWNAAIHPANIEGGTLREVTTQDRTGRSILRFYGDAEACWGPFKMPGRHITGFTTKFN